jgi:hypothetical protein
MTVWFYTNPITQEYAQLSPVHDWRQAQVNALDAVWGVGAGREVPVPAGTHRLNPEWTDVTNTWLLETLNQRNGWPTPLSTRARPNYGKWMLQEFDRTVVVGAATTPAAGPVARHYQAGADWARTQQYYERVV